MEFSFNSQDIEDWALFSSDRNPIHFDSIAARKIGAKKAVVHGMLTLLPVKQYMLSQMEEKNASWTQFKASFRSPILRDDAVSLITKKQRNKLSFKANSLDQEKHYLIGNVIQVDTEYWESNTEVHQLDHENISLQYQSFYEKFDHYFEYWIWLDSLIFGHFIHNQIGYLFSELNIKEEKSHEIENLSEHIVLQFSHKTKFSNFILNQLSLPDPIPSISYQIDRLNFNHQGSAIIGTLEIGVKVNGHHQMTIELGLMIKLEQS